MTGSVFDDRVCTLGEGPLWHPLRNELFWFDILGQRLLTQGQNGAQHWDFDEPVSAAGWIDADHLLIASATGLWRFDLASGMRKLICPLEQNNPATRSNDGRADPWGGFWIGTMGINAEPGAGAIYRYYQGVMRKLFSPITISNAICFAPNRSTAYFTDTATGQIMKTALDRNGWPAGPPEVFVDLSREGANPDGAVVDAEGGLWVALWGAGRVASYAPDGRFLRAIHLPAHQVTCPAFGGPDLSTLYVTSAAKGLSQQVREHAPEQGMTFQIDVQTKGLSEPRILL